MPVNSLLRSAPLPPSGFSESSLSSASPTYALLRPPTGAKPLSDPGLAPTPTAPTVLLYAHYDVQPPLDEDAWRTPPFQLTEVDGRWYGRGAADCKGNIVVHLTALRALGDDIPVNLKLVVEGSEEQGTGGLEDFVPKNADLLRSDVILVCDTGNAAVGRPAATVSLRGMVNVIVTSRGSALGSALWHVRRPRTRCACRAGRNAGNATRRQGQYHDHRAGQQRDLDGRAVSA